MGFDEVCRRAGGRRAYNRKRRLARARRISAIIALQALGVVKGRKVAALLGVHEGTVSRDLKFVRRVRGEYRQMIGYECKLRRLDVAHPRRIISLVTTLA